jgi:hypothetical protein
VKLFRRRPPVEQVVVEAQLDYHAAVAEGLRDALAETRREHAADKARLERENAALKAQLAVALLPQWMAAGLRAHRRLTTDHTAVLRGHR